jgi:RimJ/RimL family protein N-acetyltransferase
MIVGDRSSPAPDGVVLRSVTQDDLPIFFEHERDPAANYMAAFTAKDPSDRGAFDAHWAKIRGDQSITIRTILFDGQVAGHVASFGRSGELEITYWIGREYWGRGIATRSLAQFLKVVTECPLHARAAKDNIASIRVLQKCGFVTTGESKSFANARGKEIEEVILKFE